MISPVRFLLAAAALLAAAPALADPVQLHLSFADGGPQATMVATWRSAATSGSCRVGATTGYELGSFAATRITYSVYDTSGSTSPPNLYSAEMTGLAPDTTYYYQCGSSSHGYSPQQTFRTAPARTTTAPIRFAVFADAQTYSSTMVAYRRQLRDVMLARQTSGTPPYSFLLGNGDFCDRAGYQREWDGFFEDIQPLASAAPLMPSIGGHEFIANVTRTVAPEYFGQFVTPTHPPASGYEPESYYSFNWGYVHVISLGEPPDSTGTGPETAWLRDDLIAAKADPNVRWIISFHHLPPYSAGKYSPTSSVREHWAKPLLEAYDVPLHFMAHNHNYQRTKPIKNGAVVSSGGTIYVGAGGMSTEELYACFVPKPAEFEHCIEKRSYADVLVEPGRLVLTEVANDGSVIDTFTLTRGSQDCADGTPDGQCSATKPKRCSAGALVDACGGCGCPNAGEVCSTATGRCAVPPTWRAPQLASEPAVDGQLPEYGDLTPVALNGNDAAGSAQVRLGWTPQALYVAYEVLDDQLSPASGAEDALWDGDGVELMLDTLLDRGATAASDDFHFLVSSSGQIADSRGWSDFGFTAGASAAVAQSAGGYRVELRVPFAALGLSPSIGLRTGFDVAVNDKDGTAQTRSRDWAGLTSFNDPAGWGVLELVAGQPGQPDAGAPPLADAGPAQVDAATAMDAAHSEESDASDASDSSDSSDASEAAADAGVAPTSDGGAGSLEGEGSCGCASGGGGPALLAALALGLLRRKRSRRQCPSVSVRVRP